MPKADVRLKEDTFPCPVTRVGHGLQRAFILSLLQTLVSSGSEHPQGTAPVSTDTHTQVDLKPALIPHLILAIEEPELFQHPNRQRHLSKILLRLSQGEIPGVAKRTQVLYCTHSPLFVDLARFDSVRRFTKTRNPDSDSLPPITQVTANTLGAVAQKLSSAQDSPPSTPFTAQSLQGRMRALMTPWLNEGFFADVVVLVEGEDDRAAILGTASFKGEDLEKIGVSVIPCGGKDSLDRPLLAFSGFDIPTYTVFDGDRTDPKAVSTNRAILRLLGIDSPVDYPPTTVEKNYAVFETTLCKFLESNVPEEIYSLTVDQCKQEYGYPDIDRCRKSPVFIEMLLKNARRRDVSIPELEQMIDKILDLVRR